VRSVTEWLDTPLKWIGAITAVISLVLGVNELTKVFSQTGERRGRVTELQRVASEQQKSGDYAAAWATLDQASKAAEEDGGFAGLIGGLDKERLAVRTSQEDLAMAWLRDVRIPGGGSFSTVVDPLAAVVTRGVVSATGVRKADLLGHLGWAYFLKSRDGSTTRSPEENYQQALDIDPSNPFAHAHWGHWIMWQRGSVDEANRHFAAAVASGRERPYVRRIQLAALRLYGSAANENALFHAVDDMRRNNEPIDAVTRRDVYNSYYSAFNSDPYVQRVVGILPPDEHIATMRALFFGADFDPARVPLRDAMMALLLEAAGRRDESLAAWRGVRAELPRGGDQRVRDRADAAIARLSRPAAGSGGR